MTTVLSTRNVPPGERVDAWRHLVSDNFVPLDAVPTDPSGFAGGTLSVGAVGHLLCCELTTDAQVVRRTPGMIALRDPEYYKLTVQIEGSCVVSQDDREARLSPGDLTIYDTTRPYQIACDDPIRVLVLMFARQRFGLAPNDVAGLTAVGVSGRDGIGGVVAPFLAGVAARTGELPDDSALRLSDNVIDLLVTLFAERLDEDPKVSAEARRRALLVQVRQFVERRLADPDLSPGAVAAAHHISVRYLHKLFEGESSTVAGWIRQRRLEHARQDLLRPPLARQPISTIAARWGLVDPSRFSRLFRDAYGLTPREYRLHHRTGDTTATPWQ